VADSCGSGFKTLFTVDKKKLGTVNSFDILKYLQLRIRIRDPVFFTPPDPGCFYAGNPDPTYL
jgi:hypothetical protein